jgi:hypothetical protein
MILAVVVAVSTLLVLGLSTTNSSSHTVTIRLCSFYLCSFYKVGTNKNRRTQQYSSIPERTL